MKRVKPGESSELWIHLPTQIKGTVFWEPGGRFGHFASTNGLQFTVYYKEVCTLKELEAA